MNKNTIINVDTDSILICKEDQSKWGKEEQELFLESLNKQFPEKINFEHDGIFESVLVVSSKNYALLPEGKDKIKIKGSSLRDQKREPAIKEMIDAIIKAFIYDKKDTINSIYEKYVDEVMNLKDINRWSSKKTVTEAVLKCQGYEKYTKEQLKSKGIRANETSVWDAIKGEALVQSGDKVYVYPAILGESIKQHTQAEIDKAQLDGKKLRPRTKPTPDYGLRQPKQWNGENHDKEHLLKRLYNTMEIFESVLPNMEEEFKNYALVKNYKLLLDRQTKMK